MSRYLTLCKKLLSLFFYVAHPGFVDVINAVTITGLHEDMIVKALVFNGKLELTDIPVPAMSEKDALIRVRLAGICMTDLEIVRGYMNFRGVLGHEFVGTVEKTGNPELLGKRVVGEINVGCGRCEFCLKGLERHCYDRTCLGIFRKDGAFSEFFTLPESNLHVVPDDVSDEAAVFVEPLAAALEITEQIHIEPAMETLIIGDGRLGFLVCMVLRLTGCSITVVGKHPEKLSMFRKHRVAAAMLEDIDRLGHKYDLVVEASGSPAGWITAINHVKPRGIIALKSTYHGDFSFNPAPLVINEISVVGSRCGQFAPALRVLQSGLVDPRSLITGIYPLEQALEAFEMADNSRNMKIFIKM